MKTKATIAWSKMTLAALTAVGACLVACTEAELCTDTEHPHRTEIKLEYRWENNASKPDSMYVIANRVINLWKSSMIANADDGRGRYIITDIEDDQSSLSSQSNQSSQSTPSSPSLAEEEAKPAGTEWFSLRSGHYKFITFNGENDELIYDRVTEYINSQPGTMALQDVDIQYKSYEKGDPKLRKQIIGEWVDYNPYAKYIQPDIQPLYLDSIADIRLDAGTRATGHFTPKPITQSLDIVFDIKKDISKQPFIIDSVRAEVSGIPAAINLSTGYLSITKTNKMMFCTTLTDTDGNRLPHQGRDTTWIDGVTVSASINVPTLVENSNKFIVTGPGIMQVVIFARVPAADDGSTPESRKMIQGKINLYNTLKSADLIEYSSDGQHARRKKQKATLKIKAAELVINGEEVETNSDSNSGFDRWVDGITNVDENGIIVDI